MTTMKQPTEHAMTLAAQAWTKPIAKDVVMDSRLALAFAETLDEERAEWQRVELTPLIEAHRAADVARQLAEKEHDSLKAEYERVVNRATAEMADYRERVVPELQAQLAAALRDVASLNAIIDARDGKA